MTVGTTLASILFVGHSLVGHDLPAMVATVLDRMDQRASVQQHVINGAPLRYTWDNATEAEGVNGRALLETTPVDALVLTEAIPLALHATWNDSSGYIVTWGSAARAVNPETRIYLYETWHTLDSGPGLPVEGDPNSGLNWRARIDADLPLWESIAARASAGLGGDPVRIIPAGQALGRLSDEIDAGQAPGLTSIADLFSDTIHLNSRGTYFVALVQAAALSGQSPEGLPAKLARSWPSRDAVISDDLAALMQRVAWETVSEYDQPAPMAPADPAPAVVASTPAEPEAPAAPPAPAKPAPPVPAVAAELVPITNPNLGFNLAAVTDWTVEQPFLDLMKTARPWTGHLPGQWGGWDHARLAEGGWLDEEGWPKAIPPDLTGLSTLVLTDLPSEATVMAGRYLLTYEGKGDLRLDGRASVVSSSPGKIVFDHTPGEGFVLINLNSTDPADPLRRIKITREDRRPLLDRGQIFNPDFLDRMRGTRLLRFMDWGNTNNSTLSRAEDLPAVTDYTWGRAGVPVEVMVALANELDADAWFTLPHLADDGLVRRMAEAARDGLEPGRRAWVEFSNEVWNWQFAQAHWAQDQARSRWGAENEWLQYYALRASEVAAIWTEVFGDQAADRLVRVISSQTGWLGLEIQALDAPLVIAEGKPAPWTGFDAYAVTAYFGHGLGGEADAPLLKSWLAESEQAARDSAAAAGLSGAEAAAHVASHRYDLATRMAAEELLNGAPSGDPGDSIEALFTELLPHHAKVARSKGLQLVMYEGGTHVVGTGPVLDDAETTAFFAHLNYSPEMAGLYDRLMQGWAELTDAPFTAYNDVTAPGRWGSWGALRHLGDDNPRWRALARGCDAC